MEIFYVVLMFVALLANVGLAFIPASMAKKKGYSYGGFWCLSFFVSFLVGIIVAASVPDKNQPQATGSQTPRNCPQCNTPIPPGMQFCTSCGTALAAPAAAPAQPQFVPEAPVKNSFVNSGLSFVIFGVVLINWLVLGITTNNFLHLQNIENVLAHFAETAAIALAVALTTRAKGPDLSVGAVMGFSGILFALNATSSGPLVAGLIAVLFICAVIGAANGALTVYLKIPAVITTVVMLAIVRGFGYLITQGSPVYGRMLDFAHMSLGGIPFAFITLLPFAFILVFLLIFFTKLGKPQSKREPADSKAPSFFAAYIVSAVLAGIAGVFITSRLGGAAPTVGTGEELIVLFIFAVITSSRVADNRFIPAVYALGAAFVCVLMSTTLSLLGLNSYLFTLMLGILALGFLTLSYIARRDITRRMLPFV